MSVAIISSSLRQGSLSKIMALYAQNFLRDKHTDVRFIDLSERDLPHCDGGSVYGSDAVKALVAEMNGVERVLIATPIYNYSINAALKTYLELTGRAVWQDKIVGFLCAAGGASSYMAVMPFANSLMLDFRCVIIPRFVYAQKDDFQNDAVANEKIAQRIDELCDALLRLRMN